MTRYRKKPVVIDAWQFNGEDRYKWPEWIKGHASTAVWYPEDGPTDLDFPAHHITIDTLEGTMTANLGDWIIRGTKGELYPCKPEIFAEIYEPAEAFE